MAPFAHDQGAAMTVSCGLIMYLAAPLRALLVHPGGPYWQGKDKGAWSVPKGLANPGEDELAAAIREFSEETGRNARGPFIELTPLKQKGGKLVRCWAFEGDADAIVEPGASTFEMEWPPRSGRHTSFPEVDDARLFEITEALEKILPGQAGFLRELETRLGAA
jgi:predicted NUDIX family NTP pyrophosphohydrolase